MFSKKIFRGLWLFLLISFVGGLIGLKTEMVLKLESIIGENNYFINGISILIFLSLSGITLLYVIGSNKKRYIKKIEYVIAGLLQFVLTFGAVYIATLFGLWIYGSISTIVFRFSISALDWAILIYSSFLYPILKIVYDYIVIVFDDGIDYLKYHQYSDGFVKLYEINCQLYPNLNLPIEIDKMQKLIVAMEQELTGISNNHPLLAQNSDLGILENSVHSIKLFFDDYMEIPNVREPEMDDFFSGVFYSTATRIDETLKAVKKICEVKRLW